MALRFLSPIHKAHRQIGLFLEGVCTDLGLNAMEGHLLSYLRSYSPAPIHELHRVFGIKRSTLTSVFDRFVSRGWIERRPSPRDRRSVEVSLTGEGRLRADRVHAAVEQLEASIGARVGPAELDGFYAVMSAISAVTDVTVVDRNDRATPGPEPPQEVRR
jgi:DNA-binding MarR family transcriptional regulator